MISFSDAAPGKIFLADTVEYQGVFWLVLEWSYNQDEQWQRPKRIICLDGLNHQKTGRASPAHFVLNKSIPICLFEGQPPPGDKYVVIEDPDLKFPIQSA